MDSTPTFVEHRVAHGTGSIYAREYRGTGPAFVLMHGFPDNLHIYDDLIPYLVAGAAVRRQAVRHLAPRCRVRESSVASSI
jgi:hypothetical protein